MKIEEIDCWISIPGVASNDSDIVVIDGNY